MVHHQMYLLSAFYYIHCFTFWIIISFGTKKKSQNKTFVVSRKIHHLALTPPFSFLWLLIYTKYSKIYILFVLHDLKKLFLYYWENSLKSPKLNWRLLLSNKLHVIRRPKIVLCKDLLYLAGFTKQAEIGNRSYNMKYIGRKNNFIYLLLSRKYISALQIST